MLNDYRTLVGAMVRDGSTMIQDADVDAAIALAVLQYDKDRPRTLAEDLVTADGRRLALPAGWDDGFSAVQAVEHPIDDVAPVVLANDAWALYQRPDGWILTFASSLGSGAEVRLRYTVPHAVDDATDTVPRHHREPVAAWAAAHLLDQLASARAGDRDPTLAADTTGSGDVSRSYAQRAKTLRQRYTAGIGVDDTRQAAAGTSVALDLSSSLGGSRLLRRGG